MFDQIESIIAQFSRTIRLVDILDIVVVAAIMYVVIMWLRVSTSQIATRRLIVILLLYIIFNLFARIYEMYLFQRLMQLFGLLLLIAAVIIFQADIRRMLDRIGSLNIFHRSPSIRTHRMIDTLTEAASKLAEHKTGALIAIMGKEPWDQLIEGGIELRGLVSQPLLYSIFDPHTPGHDGVVLIEGNRVVKFAAHLPLTSNIPEVSKFGGTRHAAALGLSEQTDALIIIVSEERGTISIAERGTINEVESASELRKHLEDFWKQHYGDQTNYQPLWFTRRSLKIAVASLGLASLLWIQFAYSPDTITQTFEVPVVFRNLPPDWELVDPVPVERRVTLSGSEQAIRSIDASNLAITLDMSKPAEGLSEVIVTREHIRVPAGVEVYRVEPPEIRINTRTLRSVAIPVFVQISGLVPDSLELVSIRSTPDTVTILVPDGVSNIPNRISTAPVDLREISESTTLSRSLVLPEETRFPPDGNPQVQVNLEVRSKNSPQTR